VSTKDSKKTGDKPTQDAWEANGNGHEQARSELESLEQELVSFAEREQSKSAEHVEGEQIDLIIAELLGIGSAAAVGDAAGAAGGAAGAAGAGGAAGAAGAKAAPAPKPEPAAAPAPEPAAAKPKAKPKAKAAADAAIRAPLADSDAALDADLTPTPVSKSAGATAPMDVADSQAKPDAASALASAAEAAFAPADALAQDVAFAQGSEDGFSSPFAIEPPRHHHIWPLIICAAVVFILATGAFTYGTRAFMASQVEKRTTIQQEANGYLDESITLIQEADSVIVELDRASEKQITEEDVPRLEALIDQVDDTQATLDRAIERATQAQEIFFEPEDQELAGHAREAAEYRKQMLELSARLIGYDISAMKAALAVEYAWTLIVEADANMRSAVEVTLWGGSYSVPESRDYNQEAVNKLVLAGESLAAAKETFPQADLTTLDTYLSVKKESAELALASDEAYLEADYETAYAKNDEFIAKDAEAVELASAIPSDPLSLILTAYEELTKQLREDYKVVRSQAADADAFLRDYLGVSVQQENTGATEDEDDASGADAAAGGAGDADADNADGAGDAETGNAGGAGDADAGDEQDSGGGETQQ
jgi:hypothetical protein